MEKDQNPSKGRGNPGGSQSGGTGKKETAEQIKKDVRQKKGKEKDEQNRRVRERNN